MFGKRAFTSALLLSHVVWWCQGESNNHSSIKKLTAETFSTSPPPFKAAWVEKRGNLYLDLGAMNYNDGVQACQRQGARLLSFGTEDEWLGMQEIYLEGDLFEAE